MSSYKEARLVSPKTMAYGNWPSSKQGGLQPSASAQFNDDERNFRSNRAFALQGERMLRPCPNGKGQDCNGTRLAPNQGGAQIPTAVNSTYLGSQTDMSSMGFRPDLSTTLLEGAMSRAAAYQLVSQEALDGSLDGSYKFCDFKCPLGSGNSKKSQSCGWCSTPTIASRDPSSMLQRRGLNHRNSKSSTDPSHKSVPLHK